MSKYLFIASVGIASTQAYWTWPAEPMKQAYMDRDNWTWMAQPVESDFPFQDQADWFLQGEWSGNSMQDSVNGWYVTEGFWGMATKHSYEEENNQAYHGYAIDANDMHALVQFNVEVMKFMFGNVFSKLTVADAPLLKVESRVPHQLNCMWDDECERGFGFKISSYVNLWSVHNKFLAAKKTCAGNFLDLVDGAEFDELLTCYYRYADKYEKVNAMSTGTSQGWNYAKWWDFE